MELTKELSGRIDLKITQLTCFAIYQLYAIQWCHVYINFSTQGKKKGWSFTSKYNTAFESRMVPPVAYVKKVTTF